jgi:hypothetical protein
MNVEITYLNEPELLKRKAVRSQSRRACRRRHFRQDYCIRLRELIGAFRPDALSPENGDYDHCQKVYLLIAWVRERL